MFLTLKSAVAVFIVFHSFPKANAAAVRVGSCWEPATAKGWLQFGEGGDKSASQMASVTEISEVWIKALSTLYRHLKLRRSGNRPIRAQKNQSTVRRKNLLACVRTRVMWYFTKLQLCMTADSSVLCNHCIGIRCNLLARAYFEFSKHG